MSFEKRQSTSQLKEHIGRFSASIHDNLQASIERGDYQMAERRLRDLEKVVLALIELEARRCNPVTPVVHGAGPTPPFSLPRKDGSILRKICSDEG